MDVVILGVIPVEWEKRHFKTYDTRFLYTGIGRVNESQKTYQIFEYTKNDKFLFKEQPVLDGTIQKVYHVELARVNIYSLLEWTETVLDTTQAFILTKPSSPIRNE